MAEIPAARLALDLGAVTAAVTSEVFCFLAGLAGATAKVASVVVLPLPDVGAVGYTADSGFLAVVDAEVLGAEGAAAFPTVEAVVAASEASPAAAPRAHGNRCF